MFVSFPKIRGGEEIQQKLFEGWKFEEQKTILSSGQSSGQFKTEEQKRFSAPNFKKFNKGPEKFGESSKVPEKRPNPIELIFLHDFSMVETLEFYQNLAMPNLAQNIRSRIIFNKNVFFWPFHQTFSEIWNYVDL